MGTSTEKTDLELRNLMTNKCLEHHIMPSEITIELMILAYTIGCEDTINWTRDQISDLVDLTGRL